MKITRIHARQILDSRDNPTVEADVELESGVVGRAAVPSGASTGKFEDLELRDNNAEEYDGKGVMIAVGNVNSILAPKLLGMEVEDQRGIDQVMITADGTENKGRLGANAILAVSLASAHAAALDQKIPLFHYFQKLSGENTETFRLPVPMINVINGGRHAAGSTDFQEYMIMPVSASSFSKAVQMSSEVFHELADVLTAKGYGTTVGDEGGYAPHVENGNKEPLELISKAVEQAGYTLGKDFVFALDVAASELYDGKCYQLKTENKELSQDEMISLLGSLSQEYPIVSIEDGLAQDDWEGWMKLNASLGSNHMLVGDDLLVTNISFIKKAIREKAANAVLIKFNQVGTVSETIEAFNIAQAAGWHSVISHRSGETEDTTISHLAVGLQTGFIKTGSLSRTDRTAKYNEIMRIEEILGKKAVYNTEHFKQYL